MKSMKVLLCSLSLLALACGDKKEEKPGGEAKTEATDKGADKGSDKGADKADPGVWKDIELPELGLIANAPGDATLSRLGGISALNHKCTAMIKEKGNMTPPYDTVVKRAEGTNHGGFKEMVQNEKTDDDNYVVEWTTNSGKFGFNSSRKLGDKVFTCNRISRDKDGHDCVVKVCASLKAK
jgi:hypothetical protein